MEMKFIIFFLLVIGFSLVVIYILPAPKHDFFKLYPYNDKEAESLKIFKLKATKEIKVDNIKWSYYVGGQGEKTILFVHGMGGAYDLWWQQVSVFEKKYKVVTFTLPEDISSLEKASEGILKILATENIDKFIVVGTSMGGYIAQYLVNTIPTRVEKAVFGNTFPPNDIILNDNKVKSIIVPLLPEILIAKLGESQLKKNIVPAANNSELLSATLRSLPFSKKQFINRFYVVVDKFTLHTDILNNYRIPILIIESDNDPLVKPTLQKQLKELYPIAQVHTFHQKGHFPYINAADEYNKVLNVFFEGL